MTEMSEAARPNTLMSRVLLALRPQRDLGRAHTEHPDPVPPDPTPSHRARGHRKILIAVGVALIAAIAVVVPVVMGLARLAPTWWRTLDPRSAALATLATDVESEISHMVSQVRPRAAGAGPAPETYRSDAWAFVVTTSQANAWINARLPKWVANRNTGRPDDVSWPPEIDQVQVDFVPGRIHVGARIVADPKSTPQGLGSPARILSATLIPSIAADGSLWMRAERIAIGSLPLPSSLMMAGAASGPGSRALPQPLRDLPQTRALLSAFSAEAPISRAPTLGLNDGRQVRLLSIQAVDGQLVITCRTEKKGL